MYKSPIKDCFNWRKHCIHFRVYLILNLLQHLALSPAHCKSLYKLVNWMNEHCSHLSIPLLSVLQGVKEDELPRVMSPINQDHNGPWVFSRDTWCNLESPAPWVMLKRRAELTEMQNTVWQTCSLLARQHPQGVEFSGKRQVCRHHGF